MSLATLTIHDYVLLISSFDDHFIQSYCDIQSEEQNLRVSEYQKSIQGGRKRDRESKRLHCGIEAEGEEKRYGGNEFSRKSMQLMLIRKQRLTLEYFVFVFVLLF